MIILDAGSKIFIVYVVIQKQKKMLVSLKKQAKIVAQVGALLFNKTITEVLAKYSDHNGIFSIKYSVELLKYFEINNHIINLEKDKQPLFGLIYSLELVDLEILKTFIKTNLANSFISLFKSFTRALILFD